jgi:hypothetical protein
MRKLEKKEKEKEKHLQAHIVSLDKSENFGLML